MVPSLLYLMTFCKQQITAESYTNNIKKFKKNQ
jgi:hypothetical protein